MDGSATGKRRVLDRRDFLQRSGRAAAGLGALYLAGGLTSCSRSTGPGPGGGRPPEPGEVKPPVVVPAHDCDFAVARGPDPAAQLRAALYAVGGIERFEPAGKRVVIKPNAAFANPPEAASTTLPELVGEMVRICLEAGAASVLVCDHLLTDLPDQTLEVNGIAPAARAAGASVKAYATSRPGPGRTIAIPGATAVVDPAVLNEVLDADLLINMPKAKHHSGALLSLSMKNLIGTLVNMGSMHQVDLHRAIAELSTAVKPGLIVMDATSILLNNGPGGPGRTDAPGEVIVGRDPVAVDSYATTLFGKTAAGIPSIAYAAEIGVGTTDYASLGMRRIEP